MGGRTLSHYNFHLLANQHKYVTYKKLQWTRSRKSFRGDFFVFMAYVDQGEQGIVEPRLYVRPVVQTLSTKGV